MKILVIGLTSLCLTAGVVAGMLVSRLPATTTPDDGPASPGMPNTLVAELDLNSDQQRQMRRIWQEVQSKVQDCYLRATNLQKQRDDEIVKLLTEEQKAKFEKIAKRFHELDVMISKEREQVFNEAINETRKLLTHEQREKYDKILRSRTGKVPATGRVAFALEPFSY